MKLPKPILWLGFFLFGVCDNPYSPILPGEYTGEVYDEVVPTFRPRTVASMIEEESSWTPKPKRKYTRKATSTSKKKSTAKKTTRKKQQKRKTARR